MVHSHSYSCALPVSQLRGPSQLSYREGNIRILPDHSETEKKCLPDRMNHSLDRHSQLWEVRTNQRHLFGESRSIFVRAHSLLALHAVESPQDALENSPHRTGATVASQTVQASYMGGCSEGSLTNHMWGSTMVPAYFSPRHEGSTA